MGLREEYQNWEVRRVAILGKDPMWRMSVYRLARFTADRAWEDVRRLGADSHTREIATQLNRSICAICADLAEGYSRSSGRDRVRFYEYALGSARESREWYLQGEPVLGEERTAGATHLPGRICRLTLSLIPAERRRLIRPSASSPRPNPPPPTGTHPAPHASRSTKHA